MLAGASFWASRHQTQGGFYAFSLCLSLNEVNGIELSVNLCLCGYDM